MNAERAKLKIFFVFSYFLISFLVLQPVKAMNFTSINATADLTWIKWEWSANGTEPINYTIKVYDENNNTIENWTDIGSQSYYLLNPAHSGTAYTIIVNGTDALGSTDSITNTTETYDTPYPIKSKYFYLYLFMFFTAFVLLFLSRYLEDEVFSIFSGFVFTIIGIFFARQGFPKFNNFLYVPLIMILIGFGFYLVLSSGIKMFKGKL